MSAQTKSRIPLIPLLVLWLRVTTAPAAAAPFGEGPPDILRPAAGQQTDPDALFREARRLGAEGKYREAQELCRAILKAAPEYLDVQVYLGRLYLWQKEYEAGRRELFRVLAADPGHAEARHAMIDAWLWTDRLREALDECDKGLEYHPDDEGFLYKKALILFLQKDYAASARTLRRLLQIEPEHPDALRLYRQIRSSTPLWGFAQEYRLENAERENQDLRPWHYLSLEISRYPSWGSAAFRINYADRDYGAGGQNGKQFELESYPVFGKGIYAYLNAGFSPDVIFPRYRLGGELYAGIAGGLELSAGLRYLEFESTNVVLFTGSLGAYFRNAWVSLRPYVSSGSYGTDVSGLLRVRRYIRGTDEFMGVLAGIGVTPVDLTFLEDIERYSSFRFGLELMLRLSKVLAVRGQLRYEREEYQPDAFGDRFVLGIRLEERLFKRY